MRQCTNDYKIQPIRKKIRQLCNITYGKHFPKDKFVDQWIGISMDEISRMKPARDKYINNVHPLIDLKMSRSDCLKWMSANAFPLPEKSACICCPFHDDKYWYFMKHNRPEEFADAVEFDKKITSDFLKRIPGIGEFIAGRISGKNLLHDAEMEIRYMEKNNPPLKIIVPGRIFRHEATDPKGCKKG